MLVREPFHVSFEDYWENFHDGLIVNVYGRPSVHDDPAKPYWPKAHIDPDNPETGPLSYRALWEMGKNAKALKTLGASQEEMDTAFAEWFKGYSR